MGNPISLVARWVARNLRSEKRVLIGLVIMGLFQTLNIGDIFGGEGKMIYLVPIGDIKQETIEGLKAPLAAKFNLPVALGQRLKEPIHAYDARRKQYLSAPILERLKDTIPANALAVLGVIEKDLYTPGLNFIFGQADPTKRVALISLCRLKSDFYGLKSDQKLLELRALKEAVHELGHVFGFVHCFDTSCVMHFSNSLIDTDRKSADFCHLHQRKLQRLLKIMKPNMEVYK